MRHAPRRFTWIAPSFGLASLLVFASCAEADQTLGELPPTETPDAHVEDAARPPPDATRPDAIADAAREAAVSSCEAGLASCNGACVDLAIDPKNCGTCGEDCGNRPCRIGVCQSYEVLASQQGGARGIALDATTIYWTADGDNTVMKMPKSGGTPITLASGQDYPTGIVVDASFVYFTNRGNHTLMRVPIGGGAPVLLSNDSWIGSSLAMDATSLYWAGGSSLDGAVMMMPKTGGAPRKLADVAGAEQLVVQSPWIYVYGAPVGNVAISRVPIAGGTATPLATSNGSFGGSLTADATSVYWVDGSNVVKVPGGGGASTAVASAFGAWRVAVDASWIYWNEGASIMKAPTGGGPSRRVVVCGGSCPTGLTQDATMLYWTSTNGAQIVRGPK